MTQRNNYFLLTMFSHWGAKLKYFKALPLLILLMAFDQQKIESPLGLIQSAKQYPTFFSGKEVLHYFSDLPDNALPLDRNLIEIDWSKAQFTQSQGVDGTPNFDWEKLERLNQQAIDLWEIWQECTDSNFAEMRFQYANGHYCKTKHSLDAGSVDLKSNDKGNGGRLMDHDPHNPENDRQLRDSNDKGNGASVPQMESDEKGNGIDLRQELHADRQAVALSTGIKKLRADIDSFFRGSWQAEVNASEAPFGVWAESEFLRQLLQSRAQADDRSRWQLPYIHPLIVQLVLEDITTGIQYGWDKSFTRPLNTRVQSLDLGKLPRAQPEQIPAMALELPKRLLFVSYLSNSLCSQYGLWRVPSRLIFPRKDDFEFHYLAHFGLMNGQEWHQLVGKLGMQISQACYLDLDESSSPKSDMYFKPGIHQEIIRSIRGLAIKNRI